MVQEIKWGNPGALGLAGFGFNTILLQIHNIGIISNVEPLLYGFFWGGLAQLIAGIIDGRRGDTFGLTAFTSYGIFWMGLSFIFFMDWIGVAHYSAAGLAWVCILWGIFTAYMTIGAVKISKVHVFIFATLTLLFWLLAGHFFGAVPAKIAGVEGIICGASAIYASAAVLLSTTYGRWLLPIGLVSK
ncbi:MAG: acetate uptake transporter [Dehalococcoidia bacterium]|nr:acetate uptake transporter [Dehalococcoidia bacterium]